MSGPSSFRVALDFCAASRRACRSALPIAGSSRSMMNLRMTPPLQYWPTIAIRLPSAGKAWHHLLGEEPHRCERIVERNHIEIDLQRGVLVNAEFFLRAADLVDDLFRRADPRSARADLILGARLLEFGDYLSVAGIIPGAAAVEPIGGGLDQRMKIVVDERASKCPGTLAVGIAEHVEGQHHLALAGVASR